MQCVRKAYHGVTKVNHGVRKLDHGVMEVYHDSLLIKCCIITDLNFFGAFWSVVKKYFQILRGRVLGLLSC